MKKYLFPTLTIVCLIIGFLIGNAVSNQANAQRANVQSSRLFSNNSSSNKIDQLLGIIENGYVDAIDMDSIREEVAKEIIKSLDPHSSYISKEDLEMVNSELSASFSGIGIQFSIQNDTVQVVSVISGGPSEGIGILAGDKIVTIDGEDAVGKKVTNEYVAEHLRGKKGTKVLLGVKRGRSDELIEFEVVRDKIPLNSIDASFMLDNKVGYIKLDRFAKTTMDEFDAALDKLKSQKMKSLILDLRGNNGFEGE